MAESIQPWVRRQQQLFPFHLHIKIAHNFFFEFLYVIFFIFSHTINIFFILLNVGNFPQLFSIHFSL